MLQELDDAIVEFGLEEVVLVEEMTIEHDVETSPVTNRAGQTHTVATSSQYTAEFITSERVDMSALFRGDGTPEPKTVTITGIQTPHVLKMQDSLVTTHRMSERTEIEIIAKEVESEKLW